MTPAELGPDDDDWEPPPTADRERWGRLEGIGLAVLIALTARVVLSLVSGIAWAGYDYPADEANRFALGNTVQFASGFGDVEGILILMVLTGFLWWALQRRSEEYQQAFEYDDWSDRVDRSVANVSRLGWMTEWLKALYVVYIIGSVALAVSYALQVPTGQWLERAGAVGFGAHLHRGRDRRHAGGVPVGPPGAGVLRFRFRLRGRGRGRVGGGWHRGALGVPATAASLRRRRPPCGRHPSGRPAVPSPGRAIPQASSSRSIRAAHCRR